MKFHSKPVDEHQEVPLADDGRLEELVAAWQARAPNESARAARNACYLLSLHDAIEPQVQQAQLNELRGLVEAQGDLIVGAEQHVLRRKDPRTYVGVGVAERLAAAARAANATMLVIDAELSPSQARNLEDVTGFPICDRENVILNVFRKHASTKRAALQVEIAHLEYLRPRIRGIGLNMDQQMGGSNKARGPGETASELLARRIDKRMADLRRRLGQLKESDAAQRKSRSNAARVTLVGYTNAGKTSLMNALTNADLSARDRPFETLDTTSRALTRHGGDVLLSDTVGFIRKLPERLMASFESTLAEVAEASLLLVVLDASDPEVGAHLVTTLDMLRKLAADQVPRLIVFNKCDKLSETPAFEVLAGEDPYVTVSSHDAASVQALRERVLAGARQSQLEREVFVPYTLPAVVKHIYAHCRVSRTEALENGTQFTIQGLPHHIQSILQMTKEFSA